MPAYADEIARDVLRDLARKQRLANEVARHIPRFALDAEELQEASAKELAVKVLRHLGLIEPNGSPPSDPVQALESYLAGKKDTADRAAGRRSAHDASDQSFVSRYIGKA